MHVHVTGEVTWNLAFVRATLASLIAMAGPLDEAEGLIGLYKAGEFSPTQQTTLAEFAAEECDFTDYARKNPDPVAPVRLGEDVEGIVGEAQFHMTTSPVVTSNDVGGWFYVDAAGTGVAAFAPFPEPVSMGQVGAKLLVVVRLPWEASQEPTDIV